MYRTIMLHLDLNSENRAVLAIGGAIARRHGADVIGIAAAQPMPPVADAGYYGGVAVAAEMLQLDQTQAAQALAACEKQFRDAIGAGKGGIEWRAAFTPAPLPAWMARQARAADLIVTGPTRPFSLFETQTRVNIGSLAMAAGRPVLVVPPNAEALSLRHVLVAWKDTREARRALTDALPLLLEAEKVVVLAVSEGEALAAAQAGVEDVARWLSRHGVRAVPEALAADTDEDIVLAEEIAGRAPDLVVAGAYGHSRLNEWAFGGITRDLLLRSGTCVLLSH
jgi:nucleotide-binding universal stress UspA family protein